MEGGKLVPLKALSKRLVIHREVTLTTFITQKLLKAVVSSNTSYSELSADTAGAIQLLFTGEK